MSAPTVAEAREAMAEHAWRTSHSPEKSILLANNLAAVVAVVVLDEAANLYDDVAHHRVSGDDALAKANDLRDRAEKALL